MLEDVKKELLNHPDKLKEVLEHFGYCNVVIRDRYMQFGRDEVSSKKSIVLAIFGLPIKRASVRASS